MAKVSAYWRPAGLGEALALLERPHTVPIGGGTAVNASPTSESIEVVDLQALQLGGIDRLEPGRLTIGATATLDEIANHPEVPPAAREAARREGPGTLRAMATIGGAIMTPDWESELQAVLLAHGAVVKVAGRDGEAELPLEAVLGDPAAVAGRLVIAVTLETSGVTSAQRVARTRADRAIVAAVARRDGRGETHLALSGVAATPVVVENVDSLDPPGDFRGSKEYRRALAAVLSRRVLEAVR